MNRKLWFPCAAVLLILTALVTSFLLSRSLPTTGAPVTPPTPSVAPSPTVSFPTATPSPTAPLPTLDWGYLPTVTPPGHNEPMLPPEALAMRAAPSATPSPIPPTQTPAPTPTPTWTPPVPLGYDDAPMVEVPAGEFIMGLPVELGLQLYYQRAWWDDYGFITDIPQLIVYLDTFWIDKFEVTNRRYRRCVEAGVCRPVQDLSGLPENYGNDLVYADYPVRGVDWIDADVYCRWVGKRLPTEAEWEKAARGSEGQLYPWGTEWDAQAAYTGTNSVPVGSYFKDISPYGAMDMAGNATEWVADLFRPYPGNPRADSLNRLIEFVKYDLHVVRGFGGNQAWSIAAVRKLAENKAASAWSTSIPGFRCARGEPTDWFNSIISSTTIATPQPLGSVDLSRMVYVPAGEFIMGTENGSRESPQHIVYLNAFYIDRYEVTTSEYAAFLNTLSDPTWQCRGYPCVNLAYSNLDYTDGKYLVKPGQEHVPVMCVTWEGAYTYCWWVSKRLPTEAEWEKAARGVDGRKYPWGNNWDPAKAAGASGGTVWNPEGTYPYPVGSFPDDLSPYGAFDMLGNLCEWVFDILDNDYYKYSPYANPQGPMFLYDDTHVARGCPGRIMERGIMMRFAGGNIDQGFRCAYTPVEDEND